MPELKPEVITMDKSTIYFPVTCPCCGQEYLVVSNRDMIINALANERQLTLSSICAYHRVMWVANEIERNQIREYMEALHFSSSKQVRARRYA
jgi:queuine/archaeosine tRNA-ribosyltransferase